MVSATGCGCLISGMFTMCKGRGGKRERLTGFGGQGFSDTRRAREEHDHAHTCRLLDWKRKAVNGLDVPFP